MFGQRRQQLPPVDADSKRVAGRRHFLICCRRAAAGGGGGEEKMQKFIERSSSCSSLATRFTKLGARCKRATHKAKSRVRCRPRASSVPPSDEAGPPTRCVISHRITSPAEATSRPRGSRRTASRLLSAEDGCGARARVPTFGVEDHKGRGRAKACSLFVWKPLTSGP